MDKALKFYTQNYEHIKAVLELNTYAQRNLPQEVIKRLFDQLKADYESWKWGVSDAASSISAYPDNKELYWYDRRWVDSDEIGGVYFGVSNITASSIIEHEGDDSPYLYLFYDARVRNLTRKALSDKFSDLDRRCRRHDAKLRDMHFNEEEGGGLNLVYQPIRNIISIEKLRDFDLTLKKFIESAKTFTERFAPLVYQVANRDQGKT